MRRDHCLGRLHIFFIINMHEHSFNRMYEHAYEIGREHSKLF